MTKSLLDTGVLFGTLVHLDPGLEDKKIKLVRLGNKVHIAPSVYSTLVRMPANDALEACGHIPALDMTPPKDGPGLVNMEDALRTAFDPDNQPGQYPQVTADKIFNRF